MNIDSYMRILHKRHASGKLRAKKYVKMVQQLMLWSLTVVHFDTDPDGGYWDDFYLSDDEREDD